MQFEHWSAQNITRGFELVTNSRTYKFVTPDHDRDLGEQINWIKQLNHIMQNRGEYSCQE